MGTNFYWKTSLPTTEILPTGETIEVKIDDMDPRIHIGKRSVAGKYCHDCNITLCKLGNDRVHYSTGRQDWYATCPKCNTSIDVIEETCSFNWAQNSEKVRETCISFSAKNIIIDEYGQEYTGQEFLKMINDCKIKLYSIGELFC